HPNDGLIEVEAAGGAEEAGIAVGEDAAIGRDEPVAGAGRRGDHWGAGAVGGGPDGGGGRAAVRGGEAPGWRRGGEVVGRGPGGATMAGARSPSAEDRNELLAVFQFVAR